MAYRRSTGASSRGRKSTGYSRPRAARRSAARSSTSRSRRAPARRAAAAPRQQVLKLVIEHAAPNAVARPAEERPAGDGTVIQRPTKSKF